jgi:hypothetical protein
MRTFRRDARKEEIFITLPLVKFIVEPCGGDHRYTGGFTGQSEDKIAPPYKQVPLGYHHHQAAECMPSFEQLDAVQYFLGIILGPGRIVSSQKDPIIFGIYGNAQYHLDRSSRRKFEPWQSPGFPKDFEAHLPTLSDAPV